MVLLANPAAATVFGSGDLVGRSWRELVPEAAARWSQIASSDDATVVEAKIGARHLVLTHAPGPEGLFIFAYGTDITREKEAERVLRQTEKMATLGTLAAGVAHELNVGAMKSYSYLGQAPIQDVDVNEGLRSTLVILRSKLKTGVTVEEELADELPRIEAFGSELNQVWTNLIDNAVDAMKGKGILRLTSSLRGDRVVVSVEDDGPGIPADQQARVFDAFYTTKPPGEGTGLGLHTTYSIVVEKHGGSLALESRPGRTRFTVELPLRPPRGSTRIDV